MSLINAYKEVASRSLVAARAMLVASLQETAVFKAYHAFESIGGALSTSHGNTYPRSHSRKLNQFVTLVPNHHRHAVSALAIQLSALRNAALYPLVQPSGDVQCPKDRWTGAQAAELVRRVNGIVRKVARSV